MNYNHSNIGNREGIYRVFHIWDTSFSTHHHVGKSSESQLRSLAFSSNRRGKIMLLWKFSFIIFSIFCSIRIVSGERLWFAIKKQIFIPVFSSSIEILVGLVSRKNPVVNNIFEKKVKKMSNLIGLVEVLKNVSFKIFYHSYGCIRWGNTPFPKAQLSAISWYKNYIRVGTSLQLSFQIIERKMIFNLQLEA